MSSLPLIADTDARIIEEFRTGSRERAASAFVRKHQRFVYSVASRNVPRHEDAQDAVQEVFIRALQNIESFKGESALQTWLYRITINVCSNMRRKKRVMSWFSIGTGDDERDVKADVISPEQHVLNADFQERLTSMLALLPEKQRETFCLRYFDELSYEEISSMVGTSVGALKANYHHAVKKLAVLIKDSDMMDDGRGEHHE